MALGRQIKIHRERQNLTLEQLSEKSQVDVGTISALENRDSSRSKFARSIAKGLGLTVEQLEDEGLDLDLLSTHPAPTEEDWPFEGITRRDISRLSLAQLRELEATIRADIRRIEERDTPRKISAAS